jgi:hypothetical protein
MSNNPVTRKDVNQNDRHAEDGDGAVTELEKRLNSRDFYELCQEYRHTRLDAASQFEAIKTYLLTGKLPWPSYQ